MIPQKTLQPLLASLVTLTLWSVAPVQAVTLNPTADAYVRSGVNQPINYGNATTLEIKKSANPADDFNREIYLKFDLSGVTSIRTAKLRLYGSAGSPE
ncbi:MAG TPA: DNRLRE domain-containing protein, partial [Opitutus sp.]|nr:DNRLRE domain-containing protein [Opitutus sp.]